MKTPHRFSIKHLTDTFGHPGSKCQMLNIFVHATTLGGISHFPDILFPLGRRYQQCCVIPVIVLLSHVCKDAALLFVK